MNAKQIIKREIKAAAKAGEFSRFEVREDDIGGSVALASMVVDQQRYLHRLRPCTATPIAS
jgi:Ni,Fe-hydrogenase III large subunit